MGDTLMLTDQIINFVWHHFQLFLIFLILNQLFSLLIFLVPLLLVSILVSLILEQLFSLALTFL
jgi:hypothetical protein